MILKFRAYYLISLEKEFNMLEHVVLVIIFLLTCGGYIIYGKNIYKEETEVFFILPWITFSFLAGLDLVNIIFSKDVVWFEVFSGALMFLGPSLVSCFILLGGIKNASSDNVSDFIWKKILIEFAESKAEVILICIGILILLSLVFVDLFTSLSGLYSIELSFALATIFLDLIAIISLSREIKESPGKFEKISWTCWFLAAFAAYIWNIYTGADPLGIGSLLILESSIVSLWVLGSIIYFHKWDFCLF